LITPHDPGRDGSTWKQGWYRYAKRLDSPNFGPRPTDASIDLVVLHSISLPPGVYGGDSVARLFTNCLDWDAHPYFQRIRGIQVSAHFFIGRSGELWQFVSCDARAWHAGVSSFRGRDNCNDYSIGIELEGLEGGNFEPQQYVCLQKLLSAMTLAYSVRYLAGHSDVAPGRKMDPGDGFEWERLADLAVKVGLALPEK